ncbi:FAD-dependent oxidoreductase [Novosphingobium sp. AAP93]|uniref:FAD-dependent oxidoreductase n=1 Tax=Novosphingobium sp. AAP93 TaxID=1523427 RepID=UPI0006B93371|nr:GMC family oxidoreductase [Novosphingobium sp. AAP93]KPF89731.1 hypothetical protein IP83_01590 [Novosphingobium sp. AAP93]
MTTFVDAERAELGPVLDADTCIVGAGAAGITLAMDLAARKQHVLLVEAGAESIEGQTQNLYVGEQTGVPYYDLASCRLRYWGGSSNHWSGYCRANDPIDYQPRLQLGLPGWPVNGQELAPFIARATKTLEIDTDFFDPAAQLRRAGFDTSQLLEKQSTALVTKNFQLARNIRFGPRFRPDIAANPYIRPVENLNVVKLVLDQHGRRVVAAEARTLGGKTVRIVARRFVLAAHAIENARLLLESDDRSPGGIGNGADQVGRNFMEHPQFQASRMIPSDRFPALYDFQYLGNFRLNANLSISEKLMRERGILSYYCRFMPVYAEEEVSRAVSRLPNRLFQPASQGLFRDVVTALGDPRGAFAKYVVRDMHRYVQPLYYMLEHRTDQAPNPDSRVTLADKRDKLGQRLVRLHWDFTDLDVKTFATGQDTVAHELSALGMGRFQLEPITMDLLRDRVKGHYHHMGTTRMSDDPAQGVVDRNQKVHGVDNLWVAGSSVFPSGGYSGPTMMIVAMTHRLADHLATQSAAA